MGTDQAQNEAKQVDTQDATQAEVEKTEVEKTEEPKTLAAEKTEQTEESGCCAGKCLCGINMPGKKAALLCLLLFAFILQLGSIVAPWARSKLKANETSVTNGVLSVTKVSDEFIWCNLWYCDSAAKGFERQSWQSRSACYKEKMVAASALSTFAFFCTTTAMIMVFAGACRAWCARKGHLSLVCITVFATVATLVGFALFAGGYAEHCESITAADQAAQDNGLTTAQKGQKAYARKLDWIEMEEHFNLHIGFALAVVVTVILSIASIFVGLGFDKIGSEEKEVETVEKVVDEEAVQEANTE